MTPRRRLTRLGALAAAGVAWTASGAALADVATDGTLGRRVRLTDRNVEVGADLGRIRGRNLFHSFERFDVPNRGSVTFTGPGGLDNVVSRVTGGKPSSIDGTLASRVPGADVYLVNPAGVVFGPDARLDVPGSFHASTADELRFSDGVAFSASDPGRGGLSVARPEAFGFLGRNVGRIDVVGSALGVVPGETLSLTGGEVALVAADLNVRDGLPVTGSSSVIVAAQRGAGTVTLDPGARAVARDGSVRLAAAPGSVAGTVVPGSVVLVGPGGGRVRIEGGEVLIDGVNVLVGNVGDADDLGGVDLAARTLIVLERATADGMSGGIITIASAEGRAGPIRVAAADIIILGSDVQSGGSGSGGAGPVSVTADRLTVVGGIIGAPALPGERGASGAVLVEGRESVTLSAGSGIVSVSFNDQPAGPIAVRSDGTVTVEGKSLIDASAEGAGDGGAIRIDAGALVVEDSLISTTTAATATGDAGSVTIVTAGQARFVNQGRVSTTTSGSGAGGGIKVTADVLTADGAAVTAPLSRTGLVANTQEGSSGGAGSIDVTARRVELRNGGVFSGTVSGVGDGGTIAVKAGDLYVTGGVVIADGLILESTINTSTSSEGDGGAIDLRVGRPGAGGELEISDGGQISSDTRGRGDAGTVTVKAGDVELRDGRTITSDTFGRGSGGSVSVEVGRLRLAEGGSISSNAAPGETGPGGTIRIVADDMELREGAFVTSSTFGTGAAGRVEVEAGRLRVAGGSISSSTGIANATVPTETGAGGTVRVVADDLELSEGGLIDTSTAGAAAAGVVDIEARDIRLSGLAGISSSGIADAGRAGDVRVRAGRLYLDDAAILTNGTGAEGGRIDVAADDLIVLDDSVVASSGIVPAEGASLITLRAPLIALNASRVESLTGAGTPLTGSGEARLLGGTTIVSADSTVAASTTVELAGLDNTVGTGLQLSPGAFLDAGALLGQACAARRSGEASTFARAGRKGGLPPSPDRPLSSAGGAEQGRAASAEGGRRLVAGLALSADCDGLPVAGPM